MTTPISDQPEYFVFENDYGSIDVDTSEHGHYASNCIGGPFDTREEAEEFAGNYPEVK